MQKTNNTKKTLSNNTKKTLYTIGGLGVVLIFSYLIASDEVLEGWAEKYEVTASISKNIGAGLIFSYIMVGFSALAALGFGINKMMQKTNNPKKTLYSIGGLLAIIFLSYLMASDEVLGFIIVDEYSVPEVKNEIIASSAKNVGMGLITCYILAIGAMATILYAEVSKAFSK